MILGLKSVSKGQLKTLEAGLAILFLLIYIGWLFGIQHPLPEFKSIDLELRAQNALAALDKTGQLRQYVYTNDTTTIESELYPYLPKNIDYEVLICDGSCSFTRQVKRAYSVSYFLATDGEEFKPREVLVYVWEE